MHWLFENKYLFSWILIDSSQVDTNNNGVSDAWELGHYGHVLNEGEFSNNCDLDEDGILDLDEYNLGLTHNSSENIAEIEIEYDANSMIVGITGKHTPIQRDAEGNIITFTKVNSNQ